MSATSRLPACHTTWQLFLRTVPKLLLFLPSIVNMLPIFPGESAFLRLTLTPYSIPAAPLPDPMCRFHALPRASTHPEPWRPHPRLAPVPPSTQHPFLVCVLRYLAFSALFHPEFPENAAQYLPDNPGQTQNPTCVLRYWMKQGTKPAEKPENAAHRTATATGGGRRENETPATGEGVRMRCRQVSVDKHKARPASVCCDIRRNRAQTWPKKPKTQHSTRRMT